MEKRVYDLSGMLRGAMERTMPGRRIASDCPIPECINTEFCLPSPEDRNNGILTMAFVDMQPIESVYPPEEAFRNGTLFPNINKPFYGYGGKRR